MATHLATRQLVFQNENSEAHPKKAVIDGKSKIPQTIAKKGVHGLPSRKALNDITNKSTIHHEASSIKKNVPEEEFKFREEMFLHDHKKCIESRQKATQPCFFETVFPGHDFALHSQNPTNKELDLDSLRCYPEPVEMPMFEFSDWLKTSPRCNSPPPSPIEWNSPPCSPQSWHFQPIEFELKPEF